jgi:hypothetical protein
MRNALVLGSGRSGTSMITGALQGALALLLAFHGRREVATQGGLRFHALLDLGDGILHLARRELSVFVALRAPVDRAHGVLEL